MGEDILLDMNSIPSHVAIIMDGNGRWAKLRGMERTFGHQAGAETVHQIVEEAARLGIKYLTLYTFSTENWKRAEQEVGFLMNLIHTHLCGELRATQEEPHTFNIFIEDEHFTATV